MQVNLSDALRNGGTTWAISIRKVNAAEVGIAGEQNYLAAGGLNATEVNEWRSEAEWNPVSM